MKANELRLGNLIQIIDNGFAIVTEITNSGLSVLKIKGNDKSFVSYLDCDFIPLTEEWLLRLGFEKETQNLIHSYTFNGFQLSKSPKSEEYIYSVIGRYEDGINEPEVTIKYTHQLQNLYFALTGEELKYD